jgi:acetyl-CoA carboxylase beta subunit
MGDERMTKTGQLIRCGNKACRQLTYASDLKQNGGKCPHCGEQVWETEASS